VAVLTLGPAVLLGVPFALGFGPKNDVPFLGDSVTFTAIGVGFMAIAVNQTLSILLRRWAARLDGDRVMVPFGIRTIGGAVAFTFAAFFALVAMMLEQSWGAFVLAIVLILAIASRFPTMSVARHWMRPE
jgi:hypothetical protein